MPGAGRHPRDRSRAIVRALRHPPSAVRLPGRRRQQERKSLHCGKARHMRTPPVNPATWLESRAHTRKAVCYSFFTDDERMLGNRQEETTRNFFGFSGFRDLFWRNESRAGPCWAHEPVFHRKRSNVVSVRESEPFENAVDQLVGCANAPAPAVGDRRNVVALHQVLHDRHLTSSESWR